MKFISYAQNFEDVMLWRALKHVKNGFYIDVGAQDPIIDSVSKAFYENGWSGINIEPVPAYADLLRKDRPRDIVLEVAISNVEGILELNIIPETGLSTAIDAYAKRHQTKQGYTIEKLKVPVLTLETVTKSLEMKDVHWLKIDVEGLEDKVLKGWNSMKLRPWIMVVESTIPNLQEEDYENWENILLDADYEFVYFDGLNRFYVAKEHAELIKAFSYPPNVFDDFVLFGIVERDSKLLLLDKKNNIIKNEVDLIKNELDSKKDPIVERKIGNKFLQMQKSHKIAEYLGDYPFYDRALPRISKMVKEIDGHLNLIDIGANIGDTISLITDQVPGSFLCIEGDSKYLPFLKINLMDIKDSNIIIEESYCGETKDGDNKFKIYSENGTTRLEKNNEPDVKVSINLKSLDTIIVKHSDFKKTNLLKIDTDGFEISVLKSGENFLQETKPIIYFEFDPEFYSINNKEPLYVFDFLFDLGYKEALFYDNFGVPINIIDISNKNEIEKLVNLIDKKKIYYYDVLIFHSSKKEQYKEIFKTELLASLSLFDNILNTTKIELSSAKSQIELIDKDLDLTKSQLNSINIELDLTKSQLNSRISELESIYYSRGWKLVVFLRKIIDSLIQRESLRRKIISFLYNFSKKTFKITLKTKGQILGLFLRLKNYFIKFKPRKKRKINLKSKKVVYIGHSYHEKTKSTTFLIDYLKEFFEVEVILDDSWNGKPFPDLSFIDESYLGVIFFQLLPNKNIIDNIRNDNIIYFPMYDQSGRLGLDYWDNYRDLKIINFCKTLHNKLNKSGFESIYIQYFPKPDEFIPGDKNKVFFWHRLSQININTIIKLFKNYNTNIHLHKTVDPGQEFIKPSTEDEKKFEITYSDWFKTRDEMWDVIKQKGIYIAPREYEGIGMSFLEAMAMGKAVIAVDNPTMNEYIKNGKNGYLFDLKNLKEIDLRNIEQVQRNAYEFMCSGYKEWENNKSKIIDFIKKE